MRHTLLLFIFIFNFDSHLTAQNPSDTTPSAIIETIIRQTQPYDTVFYTNYVDKDLLKNSISALSKSKVKSISDPNTFVILTSDERKYILNKLKLNVEKPHPDNLFTNSKCISLDSFQSHITTKSKTILTFFSNPKNADSAKNLKMAYYHYIAPFQFSDVIFIRDKTLFIFYYMWFFANGGHEEMCIYRKENGEYKKWIKISAGDW